MDLTELRHRLTTLAASVSFDGKSEAPTSSSPRDHTFELLDLVHAAVFEGVGINEMASKAMSDPNYAYLRPQVREFMGFTSPFKAPESLVEPSDQAKSVLHTFTGAMIALVPSERDIERLKKHITEDPDQLHMTLYFLGEANEWDDNAQKAVGVHIATLKSMFAAQKTRVAGRAIFNPTGETPADVLILNSPTLMAVKQAVTGALARCGYLNKLPEQHEPWIPHLTLGYRVEQPDLPDEIFTEPMRFDRVRVSFAREHIDIPLVGHPEPASFNSYAKFADVVGDEEAQRVVLDTKAGLDVPLSFYRAAEKARRGNR